MRRFIMVADLPFTQKYGLGIPFTRQHLDDFGHRGIASHDVRIRRIFLRRHPAHHYISCAQAAANCVEHCKSSLPRLHLLQHRLPRSLAY